MAWSHPVTRSFFGLQFNDRPWREEEVLVEVVSCAHYSAHSTAYCPECGIRRSIHKKRKVQRVFLADLDASQVVTFDNPKGEYFLEVAPLELHDELGNFQKTVEKAVAKTEAMSEKLRRVPHRTGVFTVTNWEE